MQVVEHEKSEPTAAMARAVVTGKIGATAVGVSTITSGRATHGFFVETQDKPLVVRFAPTPDGLRRDAIAAQLFADRGVPVPRVLAQGELDGWFYAMTERAPGCHFDALTETQQRQIAPTIAEILVRIHQTPRDAAAELLGERAIGDGWRQRLRNGSAIDGYPSRRGWEKKPGIDVAFYEEVRALVLRLVDRCPDDEVLIHRDFSPHNVIVNGELVNAVLDWSEVELNDPVFDVAWLTFFPSPVRWADVVQEAYWQAGVAILDFDMRLVCHQLEIGLIFQRYYAASNRMGEYHWSVNRTRTFLAGAQRLSG